jgi:hypothetical protein
MPVVTLTKNNSIAYDTFIESGAPSANNAATTGLYVGGDSSGNIRRILCFFDLGLIPNNAIINSAVLQLNQSGAGGVTRTINVHKITSTWKDSANWNTQPSFSASPYASLVCGTVTGPVTFDIKSLVQEWVNGQENFGFLLKDSVEGVVNTTKIFSSFEHTTVANQPTLTIDYTIPSTGKKCVEYVGNGGIVNTVATPATSFTLPIPATAQPGDLLVAQIHLDGGNVPYSMPSGWTIQSSSTVMDSYVIATKFMVAGEPNPTFSGTSTYWGGVMHVLRNAKGIVAKASKNIAPATIVFDAPPISTTVAKTMFMHLVNCYQNGSFNPPLSYSEVIDGTAAITGTVQCSIRYMHSNLSQSSAEMTATASGSTQGMTTVLVIEPKANSQPTLTLTSPANNQTLSEGNVFSIQGSAGDTDSGNVVTVKYKINSGTTRAIASGVSDGSSPISFSKALTYSNKRLFDGSTDIVGADLAEGVDHTLTVWAEDDQGGKSAEVTRKFRVIHNRPPVISGTDTNLGVRNTIPTITYSVTEPEGQSITITEYINGVQTKTFTAIDGQEYTFEITQDQWLRLALNTPHQVKIRATDSKGLYSERVYTFTRFETRIQFTLKYDNQAVRDHFILDGQPTRILVTLDGSFPSGSTVLVEACNNFLDNTPTWEDITGPTLSGRGYIFQNNVKTADQWAINIRITIEKGTATDPVILNGFGGAFD